MCLFHMSSAPVQIICQDLIDTAESVLFLDRKEMKKKSKKEIFIHLVAGSRLPFFSLQKSTLVGEDAFPNKMLYLLYYIM